MNKEFDYVAFAKNFEATNGRPPTADELDNDGIHQKSHKLSWNALTHLISQHWANT